VLRDARNKRGPLEGKTSENGTDPIAENCAEKISREQSLKLTATRA
jgi:hypothetical protein